MLPPLPPLPPSRPSRPPPPANPVRPRLPARHTLPGSQVRERSADMASESPAIRSKADPASAAFKRNAKVHATLAAELRERLAVVGRGGPEQARQRHVARGKLLPRDRVDTLLDPARPFLELSPLAANGMYDDEAPAAGHHHRRRPGLRPRVRDRRQRRDRQGRHLLPDDGQEAPARPGGRAAEPPAVHLPGRLRRRVPAPPGRGLPRPGPLRPDLLQPGHHVQRAASRRSRPCWAPAPPAAPTCPR